MQFNFFQASSNNHHYPSGEDDFDQSWRFSYLGGNFKERVESPPANSIPLIEIPDGRWVQIVALPQDRHFPIVGVAVGTYLLVRGKTPRGAVRVQVIGQQVTLASAIAQQIYVRLLF